jgi:ribosome-associated protein
VEPREVAVDGPTIRLGQLLKLEGLVDTGGEVRPMLDAGLVCVNGTVETRRGRRLGDGDVVEVGGTALRVTVRP